MIQKRKRVFNIVSIIFFIVLIVIEIYIFLLTKFGLSMIFFEGDASVLASFDAIDSSLDLLMIMVIFNLIMFIIYTFIINRLNNKIYNIS